MTVDEIVARTNSRHVVITGGEPTLYNLDELIEGLRKIGSYVQLETSGQNELRGRILPDWITWSPKANLDYHAPPQIRQLCKEVKWVVDENLPFKIVLDVSHQLEDWRGENTPYMVLMPEGSPPRQEMVAKALQWLDIRKNADDKWRYGDRLQWRIGVK
jgi:organic radical activating enzyme